MARQALIGRNEVPQTMSFFVVGLMCCVVVYQNEFMTGSSSSDPIYSELTMKFFEDSGWYETNVTRVADVSCFCFFKKC